MACLQNNGAGVEIPMLGAWSYLEKGKTTNLRCFFLPQQCMVSVQIGT